MTSPSMIVSLCETLVDLSEIEQFSNIQTENIHFVINEPSMIYLHHLEFLGVGNVTWRWFVAEDLRADVNLGSVDETFLHIF